MRNVEVYINDNAIKSSVNESQGVKVEDTYTSSTSFLYGSTWNGFSSVTNEYIRYTFSVKKQTVTCLIVTGKHLRCF